MLISGLHHWSSWSVSNELFLHTLRYEEVIHLDLTNGHLSCMLHLARQSVLADNRFVLFKVCNAIVHSTELHLGSYRLSFRVQLCSHQHLI